MAKRFKCKKRRKFKFRYVVLLCLLFALYYVIVKSLSNITLAHSNEEFLKYLLEDSNYYSKYENKGYQVLEKASNFIGSINIDKPITILENAFKTKSFKQEVQQKAESIKLVFETNGPDVPIVIEEKEPKVYIYNTHQTENYSSAYLEDYNITPNVMMASYLLKEKLEQLGVVTVVEEANIKEFMNSQNWTHAYSYRASRYYLEETLKNNPSLELIIDLHRDALKKEQSTVEIEGKMFAKILFVVGKEHDQYQNNLDLATAINDKIKTTYPTLTRGILTKEGAGVDGIYNQDVSPNMILLECGGNENNIGEISNTIEVLAPLIKEFLDEKRG